MISSVKKYFYNRNFIWLPPQKYTIASAVRFSKHLKSLVSAGFFGCRLLSRLLKTIKINNKCIRPLFLRKRGYAKKPTKELRGRVSMQTVSHPMNLFVGENPLAVEEFSHWSDAVLSDPRILFEILTTQPDCWTFNIKNDIISVCIGASKRSFDHLSWFGFYCYHMKVLGFAHGIVHCFGIFGHAFIRQTKIAEGCFEFVHNISLL